jgi:carboxymethylenebutenolidase
LPVTFPYQINLKGAGQHDQKPGLVPIPLNREANMTEIQPDGYLALPKSRAGAGVLVLHAWWGLNAFFQDLCKRLAREGLVAFAPDLYHGHVATTIEDAKRLRSKLNKQQVGTDIAAAMGYLQGLDAVTHSGLGVIGFSLGAYHALGLSIDRPDVIRAVVAFYGTCTGDYAQSQATYLCHFAETDEWVAASGIKKMDRALRAARRPATFYTYAGTGHWFFEKDRADAYNPKAARLAWQRTVTFLRDTLVAPAAPGDSVVDD